MIRATLSVIRNRHSQHADSRDTLGELSGCFCLREYLFHRRGLLRKDDACADVLRASRVDRTARLRELPDRNDSAHNCAAGLSHSRLVELAETIHGACARSGRHTDLAVARAARRLVSLVVVTANEISLSLGDADSYAISPILVHGTELGRPDHQALLMLLLTIAICAEWSLQAEADALATTNWSKWSIVSGVAWALAIWTSAYESLVLFLLVMVVTALKDPKRFRQDSACGWLCFALVIVIALLIERRIPSFRSCIQTRFFKTGRIPLVNSRISRRQIQSGCVGAAICSWSRRSWFGSARPRPATRVS